MRLARQRARFNHRIVNRVVAAPPHPAAGAGSVTMSGETFDVDDPRIVPTPQAAQLLGTPWRQIVSRLRTPTTLLLRRVGPGVR